MKKILSVIIFSLLIAAGFTLANHSVLAQCVTFYGGGQACPQGVNIAINKTVQNRETNAFVDNLGINDPKFSADNTVQFQLVVTNTGNAVIPRVVVRDIFPQFVTFVSGPGNFDSATSTLTFDLTNLNVGESRTFFVTGRVFGAGSLPQDIGISCVVNQAVANASTGQTAGDNAQLCIERKVLGTQPGQPSKPSQVFPPSKVTQIPATGLDLLHILLLIPTGIMGLVLRKKASGVYN